MQSAEEVVCAECKAQAVPINDKYCLKCGSPLLDEKCEPCSEMEFHFDFARAAYTYETPAKELIHRLKYDNLRSPAKYFSGEMCRIPSAIRFKEGFDLMIAVPLHHVRKRDRGYNQSELIARKLSSQLGITYAKPVYRRLNTISQTNLSRDARIGNLAGAFALRRNADIAGKRILVIDDVFTTGSTVNEIAKLLKDQGAARVAVLTAARAV